MYKWFIGRNRLLILLAVAGSFLTATALLVYAPFEVVSVISHTIVSHTFSAAEISSKGAKTLALACIQIVDLYLLGTVFYIVSLGLYELFIDDTLTLPAWLGIRTLDDLKDKLVGVVIVVLAVLFLGEVVFWDGERDLLGFGVAGALMVAALTLFLAQKGKKGRRDLRHKPTRSRRKPQDLHPWDCRV